MPPLAYLLSRNQYAPISNCPLRSPIARPASRLRRSETPDKLLEGKQEENMRSHMARKGLGNRRVRSQPVFRSCGAWGAGALPGGSLARTSHNRCYAVICSTPPDRRLPRLNRLICLAHYDDDQHRLGEGGRRTDRADAPRKPYPKPQPVSLCLRLDPGAPEPRAGLQSYPPAPATPPAA